MIGGDIYAMAFPDPDRRARMILLLGVLWLNPAVPNVRLRDAWLERTEDGLQVAIYTRAGGGNRAAYAEGLAQIRAHPLFRSDRDDTFDSTYCTLRVGIDPVRLEQLMGPCGESKARAAFEGTAHDGEVDTDARWRDALARVERGELTATQIAAGDQLMASINDALSSQGVSIIHPPTMPGDQQ